MDIDMTVLRSLEREKEIAFDVLVDAIEQALLVAYHRTPGAQRMRASSWIASPDTSPCWLANATRAARSRASGTTRPRVSAGSPRRPRSRSSLQRLRDAEDDLRFGEFSGKEGDVVSGVVQQGRDPDMVFVDLGKIEAVLPLPSECRGRSTATVSASDASSSRCARAPRDRR